MANVQLILASASPRRREILKNIGLEFEVVPPDTDESMVSYEGISVGTYVQELALLKAAACARMVKCTDRTLIISADTVVCMEDNILGKPADKKMAFDMLKLLSGKTHSVYTGFCIMDMTTGKSECRACETKVRFKNITDDEIRTYIKTGEPLDKAGAYGIQGIGGIFVSGIEGDYLNVVGLPLSAVCDVLKDEFDYCVIK